MKKLTFSLLFCLITGSSFGFAADNCKMPEVKCDHYSSLTTLTKHQLIEIGRTRNSTSLCVDNLKFDRHDLHEMASAGVRLHISLKNTHFDRLTLQSISFNFPITLIVNSNEMSKHDLQSLNASVAKSFDLDTIKLGKSELMQLVDDRSEVMVRRSDERFSEADFNELATRTKRVVLLDDKSGSMDMGLYKNIKVEVEKCGNESPATPAVAAAPVNTEPVNRAIDLIKVDEVIVAPPPRSALGAPPSGSVPVSVPGSVSGSVPEAIPVVVRPPSSEALSGTPPAKTE